MQEYLLTIDPVERRIPSERLFDANRTAIAQRALRKGGAVGWEERGPDNVGGRTRAIMFDPNDASGRKAWAGGVSGGLWFTNNITSPSSDWQNVNDFWANIAISAMTHDPSNTNIFYVATGEGWFNYGALRGAGIFKSSNGGASWTQLSSTTGEAFRNVQDIVVTSTGTVLATTSDGTGVQRSGNGGQTWSTVLPASTSDGRGADLEIGPDGTIYASIGVFATGQLWRSTDDGLNWTQLNNDTNGLPSSGLHRIEIAAAPSDANRVYVVTTTDSYTIGGIYRSEDQGDTWTALPLPDDCDNSMPATDFGRGQGWYNLVLAVNPTDENDLIAGAIDLFRTTDAGGAGQWTQLSVWHPWATCAGVPVVHADHHVIEYRPGSSSAVVFGHDGGISYAADINQSSVNFIERNQNYNVTQFYSVAQSGLAGSNLTIGGTQDNGTPKLNQAGLAAEIQDVTGGDGGYAHIAQAGSQVAIASNQWLQWHRSFDGGVTFSYLGGLGSGGSFINPSDIDEDANHLFFHYDELRIGRLNNINSNPVTWDPLGPAGGFGAPVTHVRNSEFAPPGKSTVFVGTRDGSIYKVEDAEVGATAVWTEINTGPLPVAAVSSIELSGSEDRLVVTFSNYGVASVWITENGGASWSDLDSGRGLPDMPVWWSLVDPTNPDKVFLATEAGLWHLPSINGGASWYADPDIPTTRVAMLKYRYADGRLVAATHGRGLWSTTLSSQISPRLALSALLEGAYDGSGEMSTTAAFAGAIPTEQPYQTEQLPGLSQSREGESVSVMPNDVIDWVLVSLRTGMSASTHVAGSEQAALLRRDGTIVGADENLIEFSGIAPGRYFVVLRHRNHLAVMSSQRVDFTTGFGSWDFTAGTDKAYTAGPTPMVSFGDGKTGLFAADASGDGQVTATDYNIFLAQTKTGTEGYTEGDFNLDGQVTAADFNAFLKNSSQSAGSQVPG